MNFVMDKHHFMMENHLHALVLVPTTLLVHLHHVVTCIILPA